MKKNYSKDLNPKWMQVQSKKQLKKQLKTRIMNLPKNLNRSYPKLLDKGNEKLHISDVNRGDSKHPIYSDKEEILKVCN